MLPTQHTQLHTRGIAAVEIVVAVSVIALILAFSFDAVSRALQKENSLVNKTHALYLTTETIESVRFVRDQGWTGLSALPLNTNLFFVRGTSTLEATTTPQTVGVFTPTFSLSAVRRDNTTKDIVQSGGSIDTGTLRVTATTTYAGGEYVLSTYLSELNF